MCFLALASWFDFLDDLDMLNTSVDPFQKGFLSSRINVFIIKHKFGELIGLDLMEDLPYY